MRCFTVGSQRERTYALLHANYNMRHWNVRYPDEEIFERPSIVTILDVPALPFRLFDLPSELRDTVYDYLTIDVTFELSEREQYTTGLSKTFLENGMRPEILLSNRRLGYEYRKQVQSKSIFIFEDQFALQYALETPQLWSTNVSKCRIHLTKQCVCPRRRHGQCRGALHASEVQLLMSIPNSILSVELEMVHFILNEAAKYEDDCWPKTIHGGAYMHSLSQIIRPENMQRVDVFSFRSRQDHTRLVSDQQTPVPIRDVVEWEQCGAWAKHTVTWTSSEGWISGNSGTGTKGQREQPYRRIAEDSTYAA